MGPDRNDLIEAANLAAPRLIAGQKAACLYFSAMTYEHFLITLDVISLRVAVENSAEVAANEFSSNANGLIELKQHWIARALGRAKLEAPSFERRDPESWRELRTEFSRIDGADLSGRLNEDGWWTIIGGPSDPSAQLVLYRRVAQLVRRGLGVLGVYHRPVAFDVWMDALPNGRPHFPNSCIDHLIFACMDYCLVMENQSVVAIEADNSRSGPVRYRKMDRTAGLESNIVTGHAISPRRSHDKSLLVCQISID
jgi:hypothetical protein